MEVHAKQNSLGFLATHRLFIMGLAGLLMAISGFTWLAIGNAQFAYKLAQQNAQLEHRVARYDGNWFNEQNSGQLITNILISNNGLNLTVDVADYQGNQGTSNVTFTSEPIAIMIPVSSPTDLNNVIYGLNLTMILNNATGTELKVVANTYPSFFKKIGT